MVMRVRCAGVGACARDVPPRVPHGNVSIEATHAEAGERNPKVMSLFEKKGPPMRILLCQSDVSVRQSSP
jgi:hypothetical protein